VVQTLSFAHACDGLSLGYADHIVALFVLDCYPGRVFGQFLHLVNWLVPIYLTAVFADNLCIVVVLYL